MCGAIWIFFDYPRTLEPNDQALLYLVQQPEWRERGDFSLDNGRGVESESPQYLYAGIALYHPSILDGAKVEKFSIVPRLKTGNCIGPRRRDSPLRENGMMWAPPKRLHAIQANHGN